MPLPKFEDIHPKFNPTGYTITNEEPDVHRDLLKGHRFARGAGISSGGEIPLGVLLPRCQELVAVDHSYTSIAICFFKAALLNHLGGRGMLDLLLNKPYKEFAELSHKLIPEMPEVLRSKFEISEGYSGAKLRLGSGHFRELRREWHYYTPLELDRACSRLEKTTLVHGDLADLTEFGKFNCLYLSNAFEHTGRDGNRPSWDKVSPFLVDNATVLATWNIGTKPASNPEFKTLNKITGFRTSWDHYLIRRCKEKTDVKTTNIKKA